MFIFFALLNQLLNGHMTKSIEKDKKLKKINILTLWGLNQHIFKIHLVIRLFSHWIESLKERTFESRGYSRKFVVGVCRPVLQILTRFRTKNNVISHIRFQTWPLGRNYVIIIKKFFKSISNSHSFLSFLLIWNWNDKYVHTLRSSLKNHTRFQSKMGKVYIPFQSKTAQKPYPMGRHIPI